MTDTLNRSTTTAAPVPDVDLDTLSAGDALRTVARHLDDHELPTPISVSPDNWGASTKILVLHQDYAQWSTALSRWTGETSIVAPGGQSIVTALGSIGRLPVQLVTVRDLDEQPAEV